MPFGLKGAPAKFQEMKSNLLVDTVEYASAYLDNMAIFSQTWEEYLVYIGKILWKLREAVLTKPERCAFAMDRCQYLGHMVGGKLSHAGQSGGN